jgi:hypothetical protein
MVWVNFFASLSMTMPDHVQASEEPKVPSPQKPSYMGPAHQPQQQ